MPKHKMSAIEMKMQLIHIEFEWDEEFADDTTVDQRNGTNHNATCAHHSSLFLDSKLDCFKIFYHNNMQMNVLYLQRVRIWTQEDTIKYYLEIF